jgi:hypothetical protein
MTIKNKASPRGNRVELPQYVVLDSFLLKYAPSLICTQLFLVVLVTMEPGEPSRYSDGLGWTAGLNSRHEQEIFSTPQGPYRLWGPPCLKSNVY